MYFRYTNCYFPLGFVVCVCVTNSTHDWAHFLYKFFEVLIFIRWCNFHNNFIVVRYISCKNKTMNLPICVYGYGILDWTFAHFRTTKTIIINFLFTNFAYYSFGYLFDPIKIPNITFDELWEPAPPSFYAFNWKDEEKCLLFLWTFGIFSFFIEMQWNVLLPKTMPINQWILQKYEIQLSDQSLMF